MQLRAQAVLLRAVAQDMKSPAFANVAPSGSMTALQMMLIGSRRLSCRRSDGRSSSSETRTGVCGCRCRAELLEHALQLHLNGDVGTVARRVERARRYRCGGLERDLSLGVLRIAVPAARWLPNSSANDSGGSHAGTPPSVVALELAQHVERKARPWYCVVMAHAHPVSAGRPSSS